MVTTDGTCDGISQIYILYLYISTFWRMCVVPIMTILLRPLMFIIIIIIIIIICIPTAYPVVHTTNHCVFSVY